MRPLGKDTVVGLFLALVLLVLAATFPPLLPGLAVAAVVWVLWRVIKRVG